MIGASVSILHCASLTSQLPARSRHWCNSKDCVMQELNDLKNNGLLTGCRLWKTNVKCEQKKKKVVFWHYIHDSFLPDWSKTHTAGARCWRWRPVRWLRWWQGWPNRPRSKSSSALEQTQNFDLKLQRCHSECRISTAYLACFLLICGSLPRVFLRLLHVVWRLVDVGFDPVDHLPLQEAQIRMLRRSSNISSIWGAFSSGCFTWASTSMARYKNMSYRSLTLLSSFRISSCRDSISFSACLVAFASIRIWLPQCRCISSTIVFDFSSAVITGINKGGQHVATSSLYRSRTQLSIMKVRPPFNAQPVFTYRQWSQNKPKGPGDQERDKYIVLFVLLSDVAVIWWQLLVKTVQWQQRAQNSSNYEPLKCYRRVTWLSVQCSPHRLSRSSSKRGDIRANRSSFPKCHTVYFAHLYRTALSFK